MTREASLLVPALLLLVGCPSPEPGKAASSPRPSPPPSPSPSPEAGATAKVAGDVLDGFGSPVADARVVLSATEPDAERAPFLPGDEVLAERTAASLAPERRDDFLRAWLAGEKVVELASATAAADGSFELSVPAERARAEGLALSASGTTRLGPGVGSAARLWKFATEKGSVLRGHVTLRRACEVRVLVRSRGGPVEGARVSFSWVVPGEGPLGLSVATDGSGQARLVTHYRKLAVRVDRRGYGDSPVLDVDVPEDARKDVGLDLGAPVDEAAAAAPVPDPARGVPALHAVGRLAFRTWRSLGVGSAFEVVSTQEDRAAGKTRKTRLVTTLIASGKGRVKIRKELRSDVDVATELEGAVRSYAFDDALARSIEAGTEDVVVPAGTFRCRRFVATIAGPGGLATSELFVAEGVPVPVKSVSRGASEVHTSTLERADAKPANGGR